ncbi:MAG: ABC-type uncharacterized transport system [Bacteroidetes bacterium ADurb.Bin408]|nr:MAG: ABC-type uncharacterized transport system [Bacteroidetes bacterium ADurb.Bin408]
MKNNIKNINKRRQLKKYNLYFLIVSLFTIIFLNIISYYVFFRIDLTTEKRYSLSPATKKMLKELDDIVFFKVYLEGKFPAGFKRLHNETKEILDEFRAYSDNIQYEFINPNNENDPKETRNIQMILMQKGLEPTQLYYEEDGSSSQQVIFPGAIVSYRGKELPVQLLNTQKGVSPESVINNSIQTLEYNFAHTIKKITENRKQKIGFLEGHGELDAYETADIFQELSNFYLVKRIKFSYEDEDFLVYLKENNIQPFITTDTNQTPVFQEKLIGEYIRYQFEWLKSFDALIIAKPNETFSERDKFFIDQFIMNGGKVVWLIDPVYATMDSLMVNTNTIGFSQRLNLDDQLFKYGVRINSNLIQDLKAVPIPLETGRMNNQPQYSFLPWFFFPVILPESNHPIVKNLNMLKTEFVSSIDIIEKENITATPLLSTSQYSRTLNAPVTIDLNILRSQPDKRLFNKPNRTIAVLLEGRFESLYKNRLLPPAFTEVAGSLKIISDSKPTKLVIVSDGDVIKNQVRVNEMKEIIPLPLGYDKWTRQTYGNKDFIMNVVNYLCDDTELIQARAKEFRLRILDKTKIAGHKMRLQLLNTLLPVLIVLMVGIVKAWKRRKKYLKNL